MRLRTTLAAITLANITYSCYAMEHKTVRKQSPLEASYQTAVGIIHRHGRDKREKPKEKHTQALQSLLLTNKEILQYEGAHGTLFHVVAAHADASIMQEFFMPVASTMLNHARTSDGETPLHAAIRYNNHADTINLLLTSGAYVNARDNQGKTPLVASIRVRLHVDIVQRILNAGASSAIRDYNGKGPFTHAHEDLRQCKEQWGGLFGLWLLADRERALTMHNIERTIDVLRTQRN